MSDDRPDDLTGALDEAFRPDPGESVLEAISRLHGAGESILLDDTTDDAAPILFSGSEAEAKGDSRYQIVGEIARGGIGIVYRGRDKDLNRDIALKVLRPEFAERGDVVARFIEEAQVGGQLQHPGIVPVYGLGLQPDGRPSFAMKLIKGRTLASLLESNPHDIDLLSVFEQVAQTIAYTHSRGVIHRDLKPANVMVGAFGEVQVVDWGFGKVLGRAETPRPVDQTFVATVRSGSVGSESIDGSVMGTPAYMPPEQALGHIEDLDERSDVFALGAILCEILTGQAPYTGEVRDQLIAASTGKTDEALARLEGCDAPSALKQLVRDCVETLMRDRPRDAGIVADRMAAHYASTEERARTAQLSALEAEQSASHEQTRKKRVRVLGAVALVAITLIGGGVMWWRSEQGAREAAAAPLIAEALRDATAFEGRGDYASAVAAAQRAVGIARAEGVDDSEAAATRTRLASVQAIRAMAEAARDEDEALLTELRSINSYDREVIQTVSGTVNAEWGSGDDRLRATDAAYTQALERRFGSVESSLHALRASPHRTEYAAIIEYWSWLRKTVDRLEGSDWASLERLARQIDPDNEDVLDAVSSGDADRILAMVDQRGDALPIPLVNRAGLALVELERVDDAIDLLRTWVEKRPDQPLLHMRLGVAARKAKDHDLAVRHTGTAVALRPRVGLFWSWYAKALRSAGKKERHVMAARRLVELHPDDAWTHRELGHALYNLRRFDEALARIDHAIDLDPASGHWMRGMVLIDMGRYEDAAAAFEAETALDPDDHFSFGFLAVAQAALGQHDAARASIGRALELTPDRAWTQSKASLVFQLIGDLDAAVRHGRRATELDPSLADAWTNLASAYNQVGDYDAARSACEAALRADPRWARAYGILASLAVYRGDIEQGLALARKADALYPHDPIVAIALTSALTHAGEYDAAVEAGRRAIQLDRRNANAHAALALALLQVQRADEALDMANRALAFEPDQFQAIHALAAAHLALFHFEDAARAARRLVEEFPDDAGSHSLLGRALLACGELDEGAASLETATRLATVPAVAAEAWAYLGTTRLRQERYDDALAAGRQSLELEPDYAYGQTIVGQALQFLGDEDAAIDAFRRAIEMQRDRPEVGYLALSGLAELLAKRGDLDEALEAGNQAARLRPRFANAYRSLTILHHLRGDFAAMQVAAAKAVELEPAYAINHANLGIALWYLRRLDEARSAFQRAVDVSTPEQGGAVLKQVAGWQMQMGRTAEAAATYARAAELDPDDLDVLAARAELLVQLGDLEQAEAVLQRLLERDPEHAVGTVVLGVYHAVRGDFEAAEAAYRRASELDPSLASPHVQLAIRATARGDLRAAIASYERALEVDPDNALAHRGLAGLLPSIGDWQGGIEHASRALELAPNTFEYMVALAWMYVETGRSDLAVPHLMRALELQPNNANAHEMLGGALVNLRRLDAAITSCRRAIELNPEAYMARTWLAQALGGKRRFDAAIEAAKASIRIRSDVPLPHYVLGYALVEIGEVRAAEAPLRKAIEVGPQYQPSYTWLGRALTLLGEREAGRAMADRGLKLLPNDFWGRIFRAAMREVEGDFEGAIADLTVAGSLHPFARRASEEQIAELREQMARQPRLAAVIRGDETPTDPDDLRGFARLAHNAKKYPAAFALYQRAIAVDPPDASTPLEDIELSPAASVAILTGPDHHEQALEWVRRELVLLEEHLDRDAPLIRADLGYRLVDVDYAAVRDVDDVPEGWAKYWDDVRALRQKAADIVRAASEETK